MPWLNHGVYLLPACERKSERGRQLTAANSREDFLRWPQLLPHFENTPTVVQHSTQHVAALFSVCVCVCLFFTANVLLVTERAELNHPYMCVKKHNRPLRLQISEPARLQPPRCNLRPA